MRPHSTTIRILRQYIIHPNLIVKICKSNNNSYQFVFVFVHMYGNEIWNLVDSLPTKSNAVLVINQSGSNHNIHYDGSTGDCYCSKSTTKI